MSRKLYTPDYRAHIVALSRQGRSAESLAREFEPSAPTIRSWVQAAADADRGPIAEDKDAKIRALEREVAGLREEREILKKPPPGSPWRAGPSRRRVGVHEGSPGGTRSRYDV